MPVRRTSVFLWCLCLPCPRLGPKSIPRLSSRLLTAALFCNLNPGLCVFLYRAQLCMFFFHRGEFKLLPFVARVPVSFYALGSWQERAHVMWKCESICLVKFASKVKLIQIFLGLVSTELTLDSHSHRLCRLETKANMKESDHQCVANHIVRPCLDIIAFVSIHMYCDG
jgi:hypothetical protein